MTEDYKKNLLDYVTGNIQEGSQTTDEIFKEIIELNRSNWSKYLPSTGYSNFHFEDVLQDKNNGTLILYGGYRATDSTAINDKVYGIIILLNEEFKPFKTFYEYEDGTKLRYIQKMNQAEDGTYYMVDDTIFAFQRNDTILTSTKRLIMLNNFTINMDNNYKLVFRISYTFPSGYNVFKCENLQKNPTQAQYVLVGRKYDDAPNEYYSISTIELNIPYGDSPTWTMSNVISYNSDSSNRIQGLFGCSFVSFNEDKYLVKLVCGYSHGPVGSLTKDINYYYKSYNSNSYTSTNIISNSDITIPRIDLDKIATFISDNKCYFTLSNLENTTSGTQNLKIQLWEYVIDDNEKSLIYEKDYGTGTANHNEQLYLYANQGKLYIEQVIKKTSTTADYYVQRYEENWNPKLVGENKSYQWDQRALYVGNKFNLLEIYLYPSNPRSATWYFPVVKEIYNQTQYNGEPYESKDSLCPLYANLYSNGSVIFSRNLYNISKQNNMTNSSVEIPNTYLNGITIEQNDLISETNLEMLNDNTSWTKNIYEVVDLNFLNTISVIDEDTNTSYLESAIKVNNAVTDGGDTNYQNTPCNKYRINYSDNTTSIKSLYWSAIDDTHKEAMISFYVDKAITSIDFISNDETTIYLTLPLEVEIGKYYSINQKIRIGE